jgi:hypothetical protein
VADLQNGENGGEVAADNTAAGFGDGYGFGDWVKVGEPAGPRDGIDNQGELNTRPPVPGLENNEPSKKQAPRARPCAPTQGLVPSDSPTMQVFLKTLSGRTITLTVHETDTTEYTKQLVCDREGVPPELQQLAFGGRLLVAGRTLSEAGLSEAATLHLLLPVKGGMECKICFEAPANYMCIPCGHYCGCKDCLEKAQQITGTCPICRVPIASLQRVFSCHNDDDDDDDDVATAAPTTEPQQAAPRISIKHMKQFLVASGVETRGMERAELEQAMAAAVEAANDEFWTEQADQAAAAAAAAEAAASAARAVPAPAPVSVRHMKKFLEDYGLDTRGMERPELEHAYHNSNRLVCREWPRCPRGGSCWFKHPHPGAPPASDPLGGLETLEELLRNLPSSTRRAAAAAAGGGGEQL